MTILVIDVGTSGVRATVVGADATLGEVHHREVLPTSPAPGLVEFDAAEMAAAVLAVARQASAGGTPVTAVGITAQRASTVVWDRATGEPIGPGLSWQDLRTVGECLAHQADGLHLLPSASATKAAWLLDQVDPQRRRDLCVGTVDSWVAWQLSGGTLHVTDHTNAGVTGLRTPDGTAWDDDALAILRIAPDSLPRVVDSASSDVGTADALDGRPPICSIAGDQQASLVGQGCVLPGLAKITFGTGGMLDLCVGEAAPRFSSDTPGGTFPIVAWSADGSLTWGVEAMMLAAGTNVEWLRDDLGIIDNAAQSHEVAARCDSTDGVTFVPALLGLGAPRWDYGARGTLLGVTRGTGRPQIVRAVLEGVAQRGADLVESAEADSGLTIGAVRIDGGMSANPTFVQALANATGRRVEVSPVLEATTLGAAHLARLATGACDGIGEIAASWSPARVVEPTARFDRARWSEACDRASSWYPELSALHF